MRFFNTAGPVNCQYHYCVPPVQRFDLDKILVLIGQQKYFVLHAPRQVGKTTYLLALRAGYTKRPQFFPQSVGPWEEKIYRRSLSYRNRRIEVWGMSTKIRRKGGTTCDQRNLHRMAGLC